MLYDTPNLFFCYSLESRPTELVVAIVECDHIEYLFIVRMTCCITLEASSEVTALQATRENVPYAV